MADATVAPDGLRATLGKRFEGKDGATPFTIVDALRNCVKGGLLRAKASSCFFKFAAPPLFANLKYLDRPPVAG